MKNKTKPIRTNSYCSNKTSLLIFLTAILVAMLAGFLFLNLSEEVFGTAGDPCKGDWDCPWNAHCDVDFMKVDEYECTNETCEYIKTETLKDCTDYDYLYCAEIGEEVWERVHTCLIENDEPCCREDDDIFIESCEGVCKEDGDDAYCIDSPSVTTKEATNITAENATLQGELTNMGGAGSVDVWFQWDTDDTLSNPHSGGNDTLSELGTFNHTISAEGGTTYYFRAVAENEAGISYGNTISFIYLPPEGEIIIKYGEDKQRTIQIREEGVIETTQ